MKRDHGTGDYGEGHGVMMTLLEGPRTRDEIVEQFRAFTRRFGFSGSLCWGDRQGARTFEEWMDVRLGRLVERDLVVRDGEHYHLTATGHEETEQAYQEISRARRKMEELGTPENASKLTLIAHLVLAAVKLPAGVLSGSVGLLNDAIDTLLDGCSSLMVYWGLRTNREGLVSRLLVVFMFGTGLYTLYEAIARIVRQEPPSTRIGSASSRWRFQRLSVVCCGLCSGSLDCARTAWR